MLRRCGFFFGKTVVKGVSKENGGVIVSIVGSCGGWNDGGGGCWWLFIGNEDVGVGCVDEMVGIVVEGDDVWSWVCRVIKVW